MSKNKSSQRTNMSKNKIGYSCNKSKNLRDLLDKSMSTENPYDDFLKRKLDYSISVSLCKPLSLYVIEKQIILEICLHYAIMK